MFPYIVRKNVKNISINILGYEEKTLLKRFIMYTNVRVLGIDSFCEVFSRYYEHPKVL